MDYVKGNMWDNSNRHLFPSDVDTLYTETRRFLRRFRPCGNFLFWEGCLCATSLRVCACGYH